MWAVIVNDDSGRGRGEFLSAKANRGVLRGWLEGNTIILCESIIIIIIIYVYMYVYYLRGGERERIVRYRSDSGGGAREPRVRTQGGHVIVFAS